MIGKRTNERSRGPTRRPRTISIQVTGRGQTTQDFAVGIGVFLLAIAFVFSFLPTVATQHDSSISGAERAQADRIADRIVHNASTGAPNVINATRFKQAYASEDDLTTQLGLRSSNGNPIDRVNVSVRGLDNNVTIGDTGNWTAGEGHDDQPTATTTRIVTVEPGPDVRPAVVQNCTPACRLVVRVW